MKSQGDPHMQEIGSLEKQSDSTLLPPDTNLYAAIDRHAKLQDELLVLKRRLWTLERKSPMAVGYIATLEEEIADAKERVDSAKYMVTIELDKLMDAYRYWLRQKAG